MTKPIDIPNSITDFHGEHYWLDNMFLSPIVWQHGLEFNSVEQGFVYFKVENRAFRPDILKITDPYDVKAFGRSVPMRANWDEIKFGIMYELVRKKFLQNEVLFRNLVLTGDKMLIEGNTWDDNIWGDCICDQCRGIPGQNWLGKILMSLRAQFRDAR